MTPHETGATAPPPRTFGPQGPTLGDLSDAYLQDYQVRQFRSQSTARGRVREPLRAGVVEIRERAAARNWSRHWEARAAVIPQFPRHRLELLAPQQAESRRTFTPGRKPPLPVTLDGRSGRPPGARRRCRFLNLSSASRHSSCENFLAIKCPRKL